MESPILREYASGICTLTLAVSETGNALSLGLLRALTEGAEAAARNSDCRAILLRSSGRTFCQGMDFGAILSGDEEDARAAARSLRTCLQTLSQSPLPVVAYVDGAAVGGGVGLAAACDIVIASPRASFALAEVVVGLIPALIAPVLLRRMSVARLQYLSLSSRTISGAEAQRAGLVDQCADDAEAAVRTQLKRLLRSSPAALAACKRYLAAVDPGGAATLDPEEALVELARTPGTMEGLRAFAEGHAPPWFSR